MDDRKSPPAYSPFTRITVTELPGNVWRMADSPTSMPSMTGATFEGLASEFSSVGFSEACTTALAGPVSRAMPLNPMSVASAWADALTTLRMMNVRSRAGCDEPSSVANPEPGKPQGRDARRAPRPRHGRRQPGADPAARRSPGPGIAAAIVTESEDGGEFQNDVGIG